MEGCLLSKTDGLGLIYVYPAEEDFELAALVVDLIVDDEIFNILFRDEFLAC